jgi:hypothetical protein
MTELELRLDSPCCHADRGHPISVPAPIVETGSTISLEYSKPTAAEGRTLRRITRGLPQLRALRSIMDEVYRLFDRRCRAATALARLAKLRARVRRFKRIGRALETLPADEREHCRNLQTKQVHNHACIRVFVFVTLIRRCPVIRSRATASGALQASGFVCTTTSWLPANPCTLRVCGPGETSARVRLVVAALMSRVATGRPSR